MNNFLNIGNEARLIAEEIRCLDQYAGEEQQAKGFTCLTRLNDLFRTLTLALNKERTKAPALR